MRHLRVLLLAWCVAAGGALAGWLIGEPIGRQASFLGAVITGTLTILLAIWILIQLTWLDPERRRGGSIGGLCGFALAVPLAAMTLDEPLFQLCAFSLVGIGVLVGAGPRAVR